MEEMLKHAIDSMEKATKGMNEAHAHYTGDVRKEERMEDHLKDKEAMMNSWNHNAWNGWNNYGYGAPYGYPMPTTNWAPVNCCDGGNEYATRGQGAAGVTGAVLGGVALAGQVFGNGGVGGLFNNNANQNYVTQKELGYERQLSDCKAENGLLKSQVYTDQKLVDAVAFLDGKINRLAEKVDANEKTQTAINTNFTTLNATQNATLACQQHQIDELMALTKRVVPNASVCPGWGPVCTQPVPCPA